MKYEFYHVTNDLPILREENISRSGDLCVQVVLTIPTAC